MDQIELACPYCAGRFQADAATESRTAACPHCSRSVTVPAATRQPLPPAPPDDKRAPEPPATPRAPFEFVEPAKILVNRRGEEVPLRRLSPAEQARFRRRLNWGMALLGMAILAFAMWVLLRVRP
jgi:hypothetical protein